MRSSPEKTRSVFLSYAREDEEIVLPIAELLRAAGVSVFIDQEDIPYGEKWREMTLGRLRAAERILLFWSRNAATSDWVRHEYTLAISHGLRVIPVPLDPTPLPPELAVFHALTALVPLVYEARDRLSPRTRRPGERLVALLGIAFSLLYLNVALSAETGSMQTGVLGLLAPLILLFLLGVTLIWRRAGRRRRLLSLQEAVYACVFSGLEAAPAAGLQPPEEAGSPHLSACSRLPEIARGQG